MKSNNSTSLATLTLLTLAIIISILYIQFTTGSVVKTQPVNKVQPVAKAPVVSIKKTAKLAETKATSNSPVPPIKKTTVEQQPVEPKWQPALTMSKDVEKAAESITIEVANHEIADKNLIKTNTAEQEFSSKDLQFNPYIGVEADYANLSSSQVGQEAINAKDAPEVEFRKADDAAAVLLNIVGSYYFDKNSSLYAKLGVNAWRMDDNHINAMSSTGSQNAPHMNSKSNIGADMFYGIGFKYDWRSFVFKSEYKIINLNGEQHQTVNIGGEINF